MLDGTCWLLHTGEGPRSRRISLDESIPTRAHRVTATPRLCPPPLASPTTVSSMRHQGVIRGMKPTPTDALASAIQTEQKQNTPAPSPGVSSPGRRRSHLVQGRAPRPLEIAARPRSHLVRRRSHLVRRRSNFIRDRAPRPAETAPRPSEIASRPSPRPLARLTERAA